MSGMSERSTRFFHAVAALFGLFAVIEGLDVGGAIGWGMVFLGSTSIVGAVFHWRSKAQAKP